MIFPSLSIFTSASIPFSLNFSSIRVFTTAYEIFILFPNLLNFSFTSIVTFLIYSLFSDDKLKPPIPISPTPAESIPAELKVAIS